MRTRGVYFILITLAFGYIIWGVAYRWASFTGGDNGVTNVPFPAIGALRVAGATHYYYVVLVVVLLCALAYRMLVTSPFGLTLRGIKSSESRMRSLGYDVGRHLYVAFVLSGVFASIAGVLYVYYNRFINPVAASFPVSVEAVLMAIIGGTGTILGPFLGSGIILVLRNWVSGFFHYYTAVLGIVFIVTVLWAPQGIMGLVARWRAGRSRGGRMSAAAIEVERLSKVFGGLRAVDDASLRVARRRAPRADRPERRRQDHAVQLHRRHAARRRPAACCCSARTSPTSPRTAAPRSAWAARSRSPTSSPT